MPGQVREAWRLSGASRLRVRRPAEHPAQAGLLEGRPLAEDEASPLSLLPDRTSHSLSPYQIAENDEYFIYLVKKPEVCCALAEKEIPSAKNCFPVIFF